MQKCKILELLIDNMIECDVECNINITKCKKYINKFKNYYKYSDLSMNLKLSEFLNRINEYETINKTTAVTKEKFKIILGRDFKDSYYQLYVSNKVRKFDYMCGADSAKLEYYIKKYGKDIGEQKYKERCIKSGKSVRIEYWIDKGYSLKEAEQMLKERQSTNSLAKFIKRFGEELGLQKWNERQIKWQETMNSKSDEEKIRINKERGKGFINAKQYLVSKAEKELCEILKGESQFIIEANDRFYLYDIKVGNKIIEYNGDYWHANPKKYNHDKILTYPNQIKLSAQEVWDKDNIKLELAKKLGYEIHIVRESDWIENKNKCIDECLRFLNG